MEKESRVLLNKTTKQYFLINFSFQYLYSFFFRSPLFALVHLSKF